MINSEIKVFVFDLGNVLIPFDYKIIVKNLNKTEPHLGDKFEKLYAENYHIHEKFEKGKISVDQFTETMLSWLDHKIVAEEFFQIYSDIFTLDEKMIGLLPTIKEKYKLVLLSNTNYIHQKYGWEKYSFLKHFDKLILSHEVGARKPEAGIFKSAENYTGEKSEHHFFTDDVEEYVEAAKSIGWNGITFKGYENFIRKITELNLI